MTEKQPAPASPAQVFRTEGLPPESLRSTCYRHPDLAAEASCITCMRPICRQCTQQDFEGAQCVACAVTKRNHHKERALVVGMCTVILAAAAGVFLWAFEPAYDYGLHRFEVRDLEDALHKDRCQQSVMLNLAEVMHKAGNQHGVIKRIDSFFRSCGYWPRLGWVRYSANLELGLYDNAIADATLLIMDGPEDKDFRWWRGRAFSLKGDRENAAWDFLQAITLQPRLNRIPFNLADQYLGMGKPCNAIFPLEQFLHHQDLEDNHKIIVQMTELYARCPSMAGKGAARIPPTADERYITTASINNVAIRADLDESTSFLVIPAHKAEMMKVVRTTSREFVVPTWWGPVRATLGVANHVTVQGASAGDVEVALADKMPGGVEAILGLSFLSRFRLTHESALVLNEKVHTLPTQDESDDDPQ